MAIVKNVTVNGNKMISSNDGKVTIDQVAGEIVIRDQQNVRRQYLGSKESPTGYGDYVTRPGEDVIEALRDNA
jgi:sugar lactone lactonase YvrE